MSQTPITVTYSLEEVLEEIKQSIKDIDRKLDSFQKDINQRIDNNQKEVNQKLDRIDERLTKIEVGQAELSTEVKGINKRLDSQEFFVR